MKICTLLIYNVVKTATFPFFFLNSVAVKRKNIVDCKRRKGNSFRLGKDKIGAVRKEKIKKRRLQWDIPRDKRQTIP